MDTRAMKFYCRDQLVVLLRGAGHHAEANAVLPSGDLPRGFPRPTREHDDMIFSQFADASCEVMLLCGQASPDDHRIWCRGDIEGWLAGKASMTPPSGGDWIKEKE